VSHRVLVSIARFVVPYNSPSSFKNFDLNSFSSSIKLCFCAF
jgi:hypothetical protein